jgi:hypothetical protein
MPATMPARTKKATTLKIMSARREAKNILKKLLIWLLLYRSSKIKDI